MCVPIFNRNPRGVGQSGQGPPDAPHPHRMQPRTTHNPRTACRKPHRRTFPCPTAARTAAAPRCSASAAAGTAPPTPRGAQSLSAPPAPAEPAPAPHSGAASAAAARGAGAGEGQPVGGLRLNCRASARPAPEWGCALRDGQRVSRAGLELEAEACPVAVRQAPTAQLRAPLSVGLMVYVLVGLSRAGRPVSQRIGQSSISAAAASMPMRLDIPRPQVF